MKKIMINKKIIEPEYPTYIIAEIGSNHNLDKTIVRKMIDTASDAGFDAIKFQTYEPLEVFSGKITTRDVAYEKDYGYQPWWEVARDRILMPREWFKEMFEYARDKELDVFSTVHSIKDAEFIMQFDPPVFKIASIDVAYLDFLGELAKFKKPIILSTGMSYLREIEEAVETILRNGNDQIALLHCVSCYPPNPEVVNLKNIVTLIKTFGLPVGFSDHSPDNYMAMASIALGACIIEKHITLDRKMEGPDHPFALEPSGMQELVRAVREVEKSLGSYQRNLSQAELDARKIIRRSIVARCRINKGEQLSREKLKMTRPGTGIEPKNLGLIVGRKVKVDIDKEDVIQEGMLE
ncbi:MAG: N-acetylneuraminate synthase [Candidatus Saganbacteria bacterium]|uniref:N-acetylneuraminate synthase n=1 Tax=Candidatus Saganbacteria bacterium TaxID=2575572 RepID=A0A833NZ85_UNCSA|nr:MAG: N-acetylneuraminate synthase [Candidatus Saganbacteria bacterium]